MKLSAIITIVFGLFLILLGVGIFTSLPIAKDDADVALFLLVSVFASFGGICLVIAGIMDLIKHNKDENN